MDDIHMEDPRKYSAKQIKAKLMNVSKRRSLGQYLFDVIIKTLLCTAILSINFTLFANSGSYNLFLSSFEPTIETQYIYAGIAALSFVLIFISSLVRPLENIILALFFTAFCLACLNQFATFERQSALIIAFYGLFSDQINTILYEHAFLIMSLGFFLFFWLLFIFFKRSYLLIFLILLLVGFGALLSNSYFNSSVSYFKVTATSPVLRKEAAGHNIVFLSFRGLTSLNNIAQMSKTSKNISSLPSCFKNVLGFYQKNNFELYPNALVSDEKDSFINLLTSYNPNLKEPAENYIQTEALRKGYFDFSSLQIEKRYTKKSSLYEKLRKEGYSLNVYQTNDIDTCYTNNKLAVTSCKDKISIPMSLNGSFSTYDKVLILVSQWLSSTGFVSDINPVINMIKYIYDTNLIKPFSFDTNKVSVLNSFKALDQIADDIDHQNGKQAYFAVIDIPSETYVYDEYCQIKPINQWSSEKDKYGPHSLDERRGDYADQVNCLYGMLGKFFNQLEKMGMLDKTTIIIEGLNNPIGLNKPDNDFYVQMQNKSQVMLAIRPNTAQAPKIDYSVCSVSEFLNSFFFTHKPCKEFSGIKMAEKLASTIKEQIKEQEFDSQTQTTAKKVYEAWFKIWKTHNQLGSSYIDDAKKNSNSPALDSAEEDILEEEKEIDLEAPQQISENETIKIEVKNDDIEIKEEISLPLTQEQTLPKEEPLPLITEDNDTESHEVIPEAVLDTAKIITQTAQKEKQVQQEHSLPTKTQENIKKPTEAVQQETKDTAERAIERVKKSIETKKQQEKALEQKTRQKEIEARQTMEAIEQNQSIKDILVAPVADGQKLSPEELKKQYHETLKKLNIQNNENNVDKD